MKPYDQDNETNLTREELTNMWERATPVDIATCPNGHPSTWENYHVPQEDGSCYIYGTGGQSAHLAAIKPGRHKGYYLEEPFAPKSPWWRVPVIVVSALIAMITAALLLSLLV